MIRKLLGLLLIFSVVSPRSNAQCTTLGQNPETAFPVCGTTVFRQDNVPFCNLGNIAVAGCSGTTQYQIKNPFWYKFTCFQGGSLGFVITPLAPNEDYDWQLYDVTGHNPQDVITNQSLVISGNWAGTYGPTGASATGVNYIVCASDPADNKPTFAQRPVLITGHQYLLMISHFSDTQSGYDLSFGGGSANITDPKEPHLDNARAACDGTKTTIKLNKRMKCNSLSADGSEFTLNPPLANVISASGFGCSSGFDMDSLILTLDAPLPPGNYTITIQKGKQDNNTLKDNCDREIPVGENIPLIVFPMIPTPMDSLTKLGCSPVELVLVFRKNIKCSTIAADGSDFRVDMISGSAPVSVVSAEGNCSADGLTSIIKVKLSATIQTKGSYRIYLQTGSDGNTIVDECNQFTPPNSFLTFNTKDTVNANFTYNIKYGCIRDTINYFHDGRNEVNVWRWNFDDLRTSRLQNPSIIYGSFGLKHTQLVVSNGVCNDTSDVVPILLDNELNADFETNSFVCPNDLAVFKDKSIGKIVSWSWDFGNGNTSNLQSPAPQTYQVPFTTRNVYPRLIVENDLGCRDTAIQKVILPNNCYIAVPNAFTPNRDGLNDYLYPLNAYKASNLLFRVYNRVGQLVFETRDWTQKWDGTFKGQGADLGTYVWILQYTDTDTGKKVEQKGTTILLR